MPTVTYTSANGTETHAHGEAGDSVMETAVRNGIPGVVGECGGSLSCATCHVFVCPDSAGFFGAIDDLEDDMLDGTAVDRRENSRLSCQLKLSDSHDVWVTTPESQV